MNQKGFVIAPVILWIVGALVLTGTVAVKEGLIPIDLSEKITHDGSRTGARVGYQSYCNPEQGVVIYENEKMPFVTDEGENVLWTKGDIDCYKEKKLQVATIPTPKPTSTPTLKPVKPTYVDPDPIINCESSYPNCKGSSIRVRQSQCAKITCCQVGSSWSIYPTTEKCSEDQKIYWSKVYSPPVTGNSNTIPSTQPSEPLVTCVLSYGTYQLSQSTCNSSKASDKPYTPPQYYSCTLCDPIDGYCTTYNYLYQSKEECDTEQQKRNQQAETFLQKKEQLTTFEHNSQVTSCQSAVNSRYQDLLRICNIRFGGSSSAAQGCRQISADQRQREYDACGTLY